MITIKQICENLERQLNNVSNLRFKIFADVGEFKKGCREDGSNDIERYINGVCEALPPDIVPIKNVTVATQSVQITFAIDIDLLDKDENGDYVEVDTAKAVLNDFGGEINGQPFAMADAEQRVFEVTPAYRGITVGEASQMSPIGNVLPLYVDFEFTIIESGVNSNSVSLILDGENLFTQSVTIHRTRMAETSMFESKSASRSVTQSNGVSLSVIMPFFDTPVCKAIERDILQGSMNEAHYVEYGRTDGIKAYYIMSFGNDTLSLEPAKNMGLTFDLVQGKEEDLKYGNQWSMHEIVKGDYSVTKNEGDTKVVVFWGDGTIQEIDSITNHFYHDGLDEHFVVVYRERKTNTPSVEI